MHSDRQRPSLGQSSAKTTREYEEPTSIRRPEPHRQAPRKTNWKTFAPTVLAVLLAIGVLWWLFGPKNISSSVDRSKYQAVFMTTGEVYFGKLTILSDGYYKLVDVYYTQAKPAEATSEDATASDNNRELIKLGGEMHGPTDEMFFNRDQVLYFENLKPDGLVSTKIAEEKKLNKN